MKTQDETDYIPDWQVMSFSGTELENHKETDGNEEEMEFRFFNYSHEDQNSPGTVKKA